MADNPERRPHYRAKALQGQRELTIIYQTGSGPSVIAAKLRDFSDEGMSVEVSDLLPVGAVVEIVGEIEGLAHPQPLRRRGAVERCSAEGGGFVAGLAFEPIVDGSGRSRVLKEEEASDFYEVLQLSRNADPETIQRVFRILAKRYHPDNTETGDAETFREILEAAHVLCDRQMRAAYDARLGLRDQRRFKIFETSQSSQGVEAEKRKRKGILALLYARRLTDPKHPSLGLRDLEAMLECPREHLEFTLWFLKESKWIKAGDNARYEITLLGVMKAEEDETFPTRPQTLMLPPPKEGEGS